MKNACCYRDLPDLSNQHRADTHSELHHLQAPINISCKAIIARIQRDYKPTESNPWAIILRVERQITIK